MSGQDVAVNVTLYVDDEQNEGQQWRGEEIHLEEREIWGTGNGA